MSTSDSPARTPMKPKRQLLSTPNSKAVSLLSSKTPDKPSEPSRLTRSRRFPLSIKEFRREAESVRELRREEARNPKDDSRSTEEQISPDEVPSSISKNVIEESTELPEKYKMLVKFYEGLDLSVKLLRLKGSQISFTNICPKIECLTDRRFSHAHLAQLMSILPEVIETKKVLVFDERTCCMKPDLQIKLNVDAIENNVKLKAENSNIQLRKFFLSRLTDFLKAHPEADEIPEATLPEPFGSKKKFQPNVKRTLYAWAPNETETEGHSQHQLTSACHVSRSFRKHFTQMVPKLVNESAHPQLPSLQTQAIPVQNIKICSTMKDNMPVSDSPACLALSGIPETPTKPIECLEISKCEVTPSKHVSSPAMLGTVTPQLRPPSKRSLLTPNNHLGSSSNKLARRPPRTRSLKFDTPQKKRSIQDEAKESSVEAERSPRTRSLNFDTLEKNESIQDEAVEIGGPSVIDDVYDVLPESLLQSIREKELKAMKERSPAISQAKRRRQMIASLPKIFNMIHFLFQSTTRSTITKEELVHKIIAGHFDIVDRREVEEQLELLLELVPEWISEKVAFSGDTLIRINKMSSAEMVRSCLEEATRTA